VDKNVAVLKQVTLFAGLDEQTLKQLASIAEMRSYKAGEQVYAEGEADAALFVIVSGKIRIDKQVNAEQQQTLQQIRDGEILGAISFVLGGAHSVSAQALHDAELLMIRRTEFDKLAARSPAAAYRMMLRLAGALAALLRDMDEKFVEMAAHLRPLKEVRPSPPASAAPTITCRLAARGDSSHVLPEPAGSGFFRPDKAAGMAAEQSRSRAARTAGRRPHVPARQRASCTWPEPAGADFSVLTRQRDGREELA
jgi:CRP-like cAMP-binding protein